MNYNVTINGKVYEVSVERSGGGYKSVGRAPTEPAPAATTPKAPAAAPAPASPAPQTSAPAGAGDVVCPIPGNVWEVKVKKGDSVSAGQVLFVLEAMKMEIEISAPCTGTVAQVLVAKGDAVENGTVLATLK